MGYYVTLTAANFVIPADKLDAAYQAMCRLNTTHDERKTGGRWPNTGEPESRWFAWMDWNYPETCQDAAAVLNAIGFDLSTTADGGLSIDDYDSKSGQEDLFIEALAPFVETGSYLEWRGEDGAMWRQEVRDGRLVHQTARVIYEEA